MKFQLNSILIHILLLLIHGSNLQLYEGDSCSFGNREESRGVCLRLIQCASALDDIQTGNYPKTCGFEGRVPIVCCPASSGDNTISEQECRRYSLETQSSFPAVGIVGGTPTKEGQFPHMAALGFSNGNETLWQCGGSLISEEYVLTAAHCLKSKQFGVLNRVRLGTNELQEHTNDSHQDYEIVRRISHPDYKSPSVYNDIALVKLDRPVKFSYNLKPACLNSQRRLTPNESLIATGWGLTEFGGNPSRVLLEVDLNLFTKRECEQAFEYLTNSSRLKNGINPNEQFCAGGRTSPKDTCQGDSGGPLQKFDSDVNLDRIVGVTSFGKACGATNIPGVYTRVSNYVPWIENIVWPAAEPNLPPQLD